MEVTMSWYDLFSVGIGIAVEVVKVAVPIAFAIGMTNLIVNTFFSVAFGGRLKIGGK